MNRKTTNRLTDRLVTWGLVFMALIIIFSLAYTAFWA